MTQTSITKDAIIIWNYHLMHCQLQPADMIWALGSHDLRVADHAADLWLKGLAPSIVMSGGLGNFTEGVFEKPEAELFAERAIKRGVPSSAILIENKSSNSGENISMTRELLQRSNIDVQTAIAVHKPYMERRAYATIRAQWPELHLGVSSPPLKFTDYGTSEIPTDKVINIMIGDLQRIIEYPKCGFMIEQPVPNNVLAAMNRLIHHGFTEHMI